MHDVGIWPQIDQALVIELNAVVFSAARQLRTMAGAHIELAARIAAPVLLTRVNLAIRNRVKR